MKLYGVFSQGRFALTYKKKVATDYVKKHGGEVRWLEDDPAYASFDARTFRLISYPLGEGFNTFGAKMNPRKTKKDEKFSDRVRFNWGYHDAYSDKLRGHPRTTVWTGKQNIKTVSREFDPAYYHGYVMGLKETDYNQLSDRAWEAAKHLIKDK